MCNLSKFECEHGTLKKICVKCKESKLFDISEYEFEFFDGTLNAGMEGKEVTFETCMGEVTLSKKDAKAIAEHFKLI